MLYINKTLRFFETVEIKFLPFLRIKTLNSEKYFKIMQQLSENVLVLNVGDQIPQPNNDSIIVYLAGTEDLNPANEMWQDKFSTAVVELSSSTSSSAIPLFKRNWIIVNPISMPQQNLAANMSNPEFVQKMTWKHEMMSAANCIFLNYKKKSVSPLPLYELGLLINSGKLVVRCSEEYFQYGLVNFICTRHNVPLLPNRSNVKDILFLYITHFLLYKVI